MHCIENVRHSWSHQPLFSVAATRATSGASAVPHACAVSSVAVKSGGSASTVDARGTVNAIVPVGIVVAVRQPVGSVVYVTAAAHRRTLVKRTVCESGGAILGKHDTWGNERRSQTGPKRQHHD
jgi:hypothetical protein